MTALAAETEARMETLRRILAWGDHFRLILVSAAPGPARDAFLDRLQAWAGQDGVPRLVEIHLGAVERPVLAIREAAQELGPGSGLVVVGLEPFLVRGEQATPAIQELNFFRDELPEVLPGPLVLVASPDAITHLLSVAADFVSVRAMTLEVEAATDSDPPSPPYDVTEPRSEHPTALIAKFRAMLEEMDNRPHVSEIARASILLRLARALNHDNAYEEATERAEEALAMYRRAGDLRGETRCIQCLGDIALGSRESKAAEARFHEALALARQTDDERGQADAIRGLASLADHASDRAGARARYEEALRLYRRRGDDVGAARVLNRIGIEAGGRGAYDHRKACHEEALTLSRRTGDIQVEADAISGFGELFFLCSDYAEAAARKKEALLIYRQIGDAGGEAGTLVRLGEIALHHCDWPSARAFFEEARPLFPRLRAGNLEARVLLGLATVASVKDPAEARELIAQSIPRFLRFNNFDGMANAHFTLGQIALNGRDLQTAQAKFTEALRLFRQSDAPLGEANSVLFLGDVAFERRDLRAAEARYTAALLLSRQLRYAFGEAQARFGLGRLAHIRRDFATAATHYGAALPGYRRLGRVHEEANVLACLGDLALARGDRATARAQYEEALRLCRLVDTSFMVRVKRSLAGLDANANSPGGDASCED